MGHQVDPEAEKLFEEMAYSSPIPSREIPKKVKKTQSGSILDLHGLNHISAIERCRYFLQQHKNSRQELTIITGKGLNSPGIHSPLRQSIGDFLLENKSKLRYNYHYKNGAYTLWYE